MFGLFRPKCPLETSEKLWIERRASWLANRLGPQRLGEVRVAVPTEEFFPGPYSGGEADGHADYARVCRLMGAGPERPELTFVRDDHPDLRAAAGLFVPGKREKILVARSQLGDRVCLVSTLAHELAHALLGRRARRDQSDHEFVTDLAVVFLGLGVFGANASIRESYARSGGALYYAWSIKRQGYFSERMFGYALALFAWVRGETAPAWSSHLRPNVRAVFARGLSYLVKTGDTQFRPVAEDESALPVEGRVARRVAALAEWSAGARLAALWDLLEMGEVPAPAAPPLVAALPRLLWDRDASVREGAANVLGNLGAAAEAAVPELLDAAMREGDAGLRRAAVAAVGRVGRRPEAVVPVLASLWSSAEDDLRREIVTALAGVGPGAVGAVRLLAEWLRHPEGDVAAPAAVLLGRLGPAAADAVPDLIRAMAGGEGYLPAAAAAALGRIALPGGAGLDGLGEADRDALRTAARSRGTAADVARALLERLRAGGAEEAARR